MICRRFNFLPARHRSDLDIFKISKYTTLCITWMLLSDKSPNYKVFLYFIYNVMNIDQSTPNLQMRLVVLCWKLVSCLVSCWKLHPHACLNLIYMYTMKISVDFVEQKLFFKHLSELYWILKNIKEWLIIFNTRWERNNAAKMYSKNMLIVKTLIMNCCL